MHYLQWIFIQSSRHPFLHKQKRHKSFADFKQVKMEMKEIVKLCAIGYFVYQIWDTLV